MSVSSGIPTSVIVDGIHTHPTLSTWDDDIHTHLPQLLSTSVDDNLCPTVPDEGGVMGGMVPKLPQLLGSYNADDNLCPTIQPLQDDEAIDKDQLRFSKLITVGYIRTKIYKV